MSKTFRDCMEREAARLAALRSKLRHELAKEKAKGEILKAIACGKIIARPKSGDVWLAKAPWDMGRSYEVSLSRIIALRAEQLAAEMPL